MPSLTAVAQLLRNPALLASTIALLTLLLSASLFRHQQSELLTQRNAHYGNALASLAARQATDATLNHDLVSLQVTVRDVARNPDVIGTTIHDVENHLLVQAGGDASSLGLAEDRVQAFTAPITFHDSVAGYVTVSLDRGALFERQQDTWLLGLLGLCAALMVLSLLGVRRQANPPAASDPAAAEPEIANLPARDSSTDGAVQVQLSLVCLNLDAHERQLSATLRQQLFEDVARHLSGVTTVYGARISRADRRHIDLLVQGDDLASTVFRAICAAQLLFHLQRQAGRGGLRLEYAAAVLPAARAPGLLQHLEHSRLQRAALRAAGSCAPWQLLLHTETCSTAQLLQRLHSDGEPLEGGWLRVLGLQSGYQGLVEKQAGQLASA